MSPVLASGFSPTASPGTSSRHLLTQWAKAMELDTVHLLQRVYPAHIGSDKCIHVSVCVCVCVCVCARAHARALWPLGLETETLNILQGSPAFLFLVD